MLHARKKKAVLLIDEAQSLPDDSMESLRLYSNFETEKNKLLQLVIFGQPELDSRLQQDNLRQLRQRIIFNHKLKPLQLEAVNIYVHHRLHVAGYRGTPLFSNDALDMLHRGSGGAPRLINVLSHKAMLVGFGRGEKSIEPLHVRKAITDSENTSLEPKRKTATPVLQSLLGLTPASA